LELIITPLNKQHERKGFDCGEPSLNQYLHRYATQDIKRRVSRVFVASPSGIPEQVIGYYSVSAGSLEAAELHDAHQRRLPRYPVPIATLGRLAIALNFQGQGVGSILIADALRRVTRASQVMAVYAMVVDALSEQAGDFYKRFGFISLPGQPLKLFLPLDAAKNLIE